MATSSMNDGDDQNGPAEGLRKTPGAPGRIYARHTKGAGDDSALDEGNIRINPEAMQGIPPLTGLEELRVVVVQPESRWVRWTEGIVIHVVGSAVVAVLAFTLGLMIASSTHGAETRQPDKGCITAPAPYSMPDARNENAPS